MRILSLSLKNIGLNCKLNSTSDKCRNSQVYFGCVLNQGWNSKPLKRITLWISLIFSYSEKNLLRYLSVLKSNNFTHFRKAQMRMARKPWPRKKMSEWREDTRYQANWICLSDLRNQPTALSGQSNAHSHTWLSSSHILVLWYVLDCAWPLDHSWPFLSWCVVACKPSYGRNQSQMTV